MPRMEDASRKDVLMSAVNTTQENEQSDGKAAIIAMHAVADGLSDHGFDILGPEWEATHHFKVTNVLGALCEVTISRNGSVSWEYRQIHGCRADPSHVTSMVLALLGAGRTEHHGTRPSLYTGLTLKGAVGLAMRERGLHARLGCVMPDEVACEVYAEVEVTNPRQSDRGKVWVSDDGVVRWEFRLSDPTQGITGMDPEEISKTIASSLPRIVEH
jgi:hypothetical protein